VHDLLLHGVELRPQHAGAGGGQCNAELGGSGATVSIYGDYFESGAVVLFGSTPATNIQHVSAQKLKCTVPAGSGTVDITVRNPNGQEGTLTNGFTYPDRTLPGGKQRKSQRTDRPGHVAGAIAFCSHSTR